MTKPPTQFEYKGNQYQIKRLDAIEQAILAQKISPLVVPVLRVVVKRAIIAQEGGSLSEGGLELLVSMLGDFEIVAEALQKIPPETMRQIYAVCLNQLQRQGGKGLGWQVVWNVDHLNYIELDGYDVIYLTVMVIKDQLSNFIQEVLSTLGLQPPAQTMTP